MIYTHEHLDMLYDCSTGKHVDYVDQVDPANKTYRTVAIHHGEQVHTTHNARNVLIVGRIAYVNMKPGRPLPDVKNLLHPTLRRDVKKWPGQS